jgi:hypothetical protein
MNVWLDLASRKGLVNRRHTKRALEIGGLLYCSLNIVQKYLCVAAVLLIKNGELIERHQYLISTWWTRHQIKIWSNRCFPKKNKMHLTNTQKEHLKQTEEWRMHTFPMAEPPRWRHAAATTGLGRRVARPSKGASGLLIRAAGRLKLQKDFTWILVLVTSTTMENGLWVCKYS